MLVSTPASADVLSFFVHEETVPGANDVTVGPVDLLNGGYSEIISFDGAGGFVTTAYADFTQYRIGDGVIPGNVSGVSSQLGVIGGDANEYGVYALFTATGTVAPVAPGIFQFTGTSASATVWIDYNLDTTKAFGATASDPVTLAGNAEDYMILSASTLYSGTGILTGVGGFFDIVFSDPTLTNFGTDLDGQSYWTGLPVFSFLATIDGDFNTFALVGTQTVAGDVSLVFETVVPEPATLTLFGAGLLGAAVLARRRRKA